MKKIQRLNGYFAYWTLMSFLIDDLGSQKDMETLEVEIMTGQETTTSQLVTHLINTSLGAEKRNRTRPVRLKECDTWTSTACLCGSNYKQALVGHQDPIVCITLHQLIGV